MAANPISRSSLEWLGTATSCIAITPHASNAIAATRGLVSGDGGTVTCRFARDGADVALVLLPGVIYPFSVTHVRAAGTTATQIFGLY